MIVEDQPAAPAQLSITKAACEGNHWEAELTLKNIGTSTIAGIEIVNTEDYEYKKSGSTSQSHGSFAIKPARQRYFILVVASPMDSVTGSQLGP